VLCAASPAAATDWYQTSESAYATNMSFMDRDSIHASGAIRLVRIYQVSSTPDGNGAAAIEALMEYDCAEPRRRFMHLIGFDESGRRLFDSRGSGIWGEVVRGTQDNAAREFACSDGRSLDASASWGEDYPFARARALLAQHRAEDIRDSR
jgi:hypothetical protein